MVADNGGREIMADLVLVNWLLDTGRADRVTLHVKPTPYYVSDATPSDVDAACARLGRPLDPRVAVRTHWFWCAPLDFTAMPADLGDDLRGHRVVVAKGDLNYRRLVGDRDWDPTTPFAAAATDLGVPVVALRTCKSEVVVGLDGGHRRPAGRRRAALAGQWPARAGAGALTRVARSTRDTSPVGDMLRTWPRGLSRSSAA